MKRESKGEMAAEKKRLISLSLLIIYTPGKKCHYGPPSVGQELKNQTESPAGKNSDSIFLQYLGNKWFPNHLHRFLWNWWKCLKKSFKV